MEIYNYNQDGFRAPLSPAPEEESSIEIPSNVYPRSSSKSTSSLPSWGLNTIKQLTNRLPGLLDSAEGAIGNLADWNAPVLSGDIDQWRVAEQNAFMTGLPKLENLIRQPMNQLVSQGALDSTLTRDALTNFGGLLADDWSQFESKLGAQALGQKVDASKWAAEQNRTNLSNAAQLWGALFQSTGGLLDSARVINSESESSNQLAPYLALLEAALG